MAVVDPKARLLEGVAILDPVMRPCGFAFTLEKAGIGSGGPFASGKYQKADRSLKLHFRYSLGLVTYHVGVNTLNHQLYMRLLGADAAKLYPGFSGDPDSEFRGLAHDISSFATDFLSGSGQQFALLAQEYCAHPERYQGLLAT